MQNERYPGDIRRTKRSTLSSERNDAFVSWRQDRSIKDAFASAVVETDDEISPDSIHSENNRIAAAGPRCL